MPSIFEHLTAINKGSAEPNSPEMSRRVKKRLLIIGQSLVARRNAVSAVSLSLLMAWLWLGWETVEEVVEPQQQVLNLPTLALSNTVNESPATLTEKPAPNMGKTTATPPTENKPTPSSTTDNTLALANQKAIDLALTGQASLATNTLEQALLSDPQAGVLFDNLRRLYVGFASQSYQLALEPSKAKPITVELASADRTISVQLDTPMSNATSNLNKTPATAAPATSTPARVVTETTANTTTTGISTQANSSSEKLPPATPVVKPIAVAPELTPAQKEAAQRKASQQAIHQALKHWSDAWSKQDVKTYFASYAPNYSPKSSTRKAWMDYRQERILAPKRIKVELSEIKIVLIKPTLAKVSFVQSYSSDTINARDQKSLELEWMNNAWLITSESGR